MTWTRIDDALPHHPKFVGLSPTAGWLYVCGLCYCARYLTDGFIPRDALRLLSPSVTRPIRFANELVTSSLWIQNKHGTPGWHVHDYLDYQPTAESVKMKRAKTAARVEKWRTTHLPETVSGNGVTNALVTRGGNASVTLPPSHPIPSHKDLTTKPECATQALNGFRVPATEVLDFLNAKTGRSFRAVPGTLRLIEARLKEGATVQECKGVVARKCRDWSTDPKMSSYLRPETLFNATKFESYRGLATHGDQS